MEFASFILEQAPTLPPLKKRPLFRNGEVTDKDRERILQVVPLVMDGKSMNAFMRDPPPAANWLRG